MSNKKIIYQVTRKYMTQNKSRTITTFIGVVFMVLLMTCVFIGKDSVFHYLQSIAELDKGKWHVNIYEADNNTYEMIKSADFVKDTAVSYDLGFSAYEGSVSENKPYWFVKAYSENDYDWMNINVIDGRLPENNNEIILSINVLSDGNDIGIGDEIDMEFFNRYIRGTDPDLNTMFPFFSIDLQYDEVIEVKHNFPYYAPNTSFEEIKEYIGDACKYTVVGFMEQPFFESDSGASYIGLTYTEKVIPEGKTANVSTLLDTSKLRGNDYFSFFNSIVDGDYDKVEYNNMVMIFSGSSSEEKFNLIVNGTVIFFTVLIIVISMVLIYNVFNISYDERKKYLGMLSSVGATKAQKRSSIYYEAFILLLGALPIGIIGGIITVKTGMAALKPYLISMISMGINGKFEQVPVSVLVKPERLLVIIFVSGITIFLSSYLPAFKIGKIGPIESIKGNDNNSIKKFKTNKKAFELGKPELLLASNQLKFEKQKTKSIVRAMAVFMIIVIVTTFGANSITKLVHFKLVDDVAVMEKADDSNIVIEETYRNAAVYEELKKEILSDSHVASVKESAMEMFSFRAKPSFFSDEYWDAVYSIAKEYFPEGITKEKFDDEYKFEMPVGLWVPDDEALENIIKKCNADESYFSDESISPVIVCQNAELSTENYSFESRRPSSFFFTELNKTTSLKLGEVFDAEYYNIKSDEIDYCPMTVAGYADKKDLEDYITFNGEHVWLITDSKTAAKLIEASRSTDLESGEVSHLLERKLSVKVDDVNCQLMKDFCELSSGDRDDIYISINDGKALNSSRSIEGIADAINLIINVVAICFVAFSSLVCILNLINSIKARREARKRDFAMLRSMGMIQSQINKMLIIENVKICIKSVIWAVVISIPMIYGFRGFLINFFGRVSIPLPFFAMGSAFFIAIGSMFVITYICYRNREEDSVLEEIRKETV